MENEEGREKSGGYITSQEAAAYASVSIRTFRKWLHDGLKHVRVSRKTIRTRYEWVDEYLADFQDDTRKLEIIVDEVIADLF